MLTFLLIICFLYLLSASSVPAVSLLILLIHHLNVVDSEIAYMHQSFELRRLSFHRTPGQL